MRRLCSQCYTTDCLEGKNFPCQSQDDRESGLLRLPRLTRLPRGPSGSLLPFTAPCPGVPNDTGPYWRKRRTGLVLLAQVSTQVDRMARTPSRTTKRWVGGKGEEQRLPLGRRAGLQLVRSRNERGRPSGLRRDVTNGPVGALGRLGRGGPGPGETTRQNVGTEGNSQLRPGNSEEEGTDLKWVDPAGGPFLTDHAPDFRTGSGVPP